MGRLHDLTRAGRIQLVFAGKAHPRDGEGKYNIRFVREMAARLRGRVAVTYLPDYDMGLARLLCAGVDVWLNTPLPPMEASGTSGMKAAVNGVPSLSVLDGWWVEGHLEDITGWSIGERLEGCPAGTEELNACHAEALYRKLEEKVLPTFYGDHDRFVTIMPQTIALNGAFFIRSGWWHSISTMPIGWLASTSAAP